MDEETRKIYEKANELTDKIMAKLGELQLKVAYSPPTPSFYTPVVNPRSEIWNVIVLFLGEQLGEQDG